MMMMAWIALLVLVGVVAYGIVTTSNSSSSARKGELEEANKKERRAREA